MRRLFLVWNMVLLLLTSGAICQAQKPSVVLSLQEKGSRGAGLLIDNHDSFEPTLRGFRVSRSQTTGSAFCISDKGYYITNAHVVAGCREGVSLWMWRWETERMRHAGSIRVLRKDDVLDLALLKTDEIPNLYALSLGSDAGLMSGTPVTSFGFPGGFRSAKGFERNALPPRVRSSKGRVTRLYGDRSRLMAIESNVHVEQGSSGGPLLNSKGQVIGVIRGLDRRNGKAIAIPVSAVKAFLARPDVALLVEQPAILFSPVSLSIGTKAKPAPLVVKLRRPNGAPYPRLNGISVKMTLSLPGFADRHLTAKPVGGSNFQAQVAPFSVRSETAPQSVEHSASPEPLSLPPAAAYRVQVLAGGRVVAEKSGLLALSGRSPRKPQAGMLIACADEWPTNNLGASGSAADLNPSVRQYIRNIADLFANGKRGHFLVYSDHWTFAEPFRQVLQEAGHTVTVALQPDTLDGFDGVFVGGREASAPLLTRYIRQGGRVYFSGGCHGNDHTTWNKFLGTFGLNLEPTNVFEGEYIPESSHSLFKEVAGIRMVGINPIQKLPGVWPDTRLVVAPSGTPLWGVYSTDKEVLAALRAAP